MTLIQVTTRGRRESYPTVAVTLYLFSKCVVFFLKEEKTASNNEKQKLVISDTPQKHEGRKEINK